MNIPFAVIFIAFCLALVPFLGFPPALDRALVASGAVLIIVLESMRVYRTVRRRLERRGDLPKTKSKSPARRHTLGDAGRRFLRRLSGSKEGDEKKGDEKEDQFNVYQL